MVFLSSPRYVTPLFVINRIVDAAFMFDMYVQFNLAFQQPPSKGGGWVLRRRCRPIPVPSSRLHCMVPLIIGASSPLTFASHSPWRPHDGRHIRSQYMMGWFWLDLLSVLPLWIIPFVLPEAETEAAEDASGVGSRGAGDLVQVLRMVRLLRLIKITRIVKASKIVKRLETTMEARSRNAQALARPHTGGLRCSLGP